MAKKKSTANMVTQQSVALAEFAATVLMAAEEFGLRNEPIHDFPLEDDERGIVAELPGISASLSSQLKATTGTFTVADTASIVSFLAESLLDSERLQRVKLLVISEKLSDCLIASLVPAIPARGKAGKSRLAGTVYQFRVTLMGAQPPIWRRIQVQDCTLDKLHEHIQTAMGWTNSHLHQFDIDGKCYGEPELLNNGFENFRCVDSTKTTLSQILHGTGEPCVFKYEYDFGDGWEHEIVFEGIPTVDHKAKYPLCLEGERACPPEDCGGIGGYHELVKACSNPKHKKHASMLEWIGGRFDSEDFDAKQATKKMKKGLPHWGSMR